MLVVGVMSGTSGDGVDVALARVTERRGRAHRELLAHLTLPMDARVRKEVLRVAEGGPVTAGEISQLNFRLGEEFAAAVIAACRKFHVALSRVDLIGSHGQTIFHRGAGVPCLGKTTASTLQIGEGAVIAARAGVNVVSDFRVADMAVGGQGAPLVPFVDWMLYADKKIGRVSLNLGGIANVTAIPAGAKPEDVFAFDTGPANMVVDALVSHFTRGKQQFDRGGRLAALGCDNPRLFKKIMQDPYIFLPPPKSTGREYYGHAYAQKLLRWGKECGAKPNDVIRAATVFTLTSVVTALKMFVLPKVRVKQLIVSGGGAHNVLMMEILGLMLKSEVIEVIPSAELGVDVDAKEAFAFALLAYETWHRRTGNLPAATGAKRAVVLGKISYA
jgi:anhydro-N-acetylmuramic acid kinase